MIDRRTTIPLVLGVLIGLLAISYVSHVIALSEFYWAVPTRNLRPDDMPVITAFFRQVYPFWWVLPACAAVAAAILLWRPSCQSKHLAWFLAITAVAAVLWGLLCALAIYFVKGTFISYGRGL